MTRRGSRAPTTLIAMLVALLLLPAATAAQTATPPPALTPTPTPTPTEPTPTEPPAVSYAGTGKVVPPGAVDYLDALRPGEELILSDEERVSRWAHAQAVVAIRAQPMTSARTITRLRFLTEDELPEVYLVLGARMDARERIWLRVRIPMRPNHRTGWVSADALSQLYVVRTQLVIDRSRLKATLYKSGRVVWTSRIGVGKAGTPTPRGRFYVRELLRGAGDNTTYGPWAFGTSAYSNLSDWPGGGVVGIHGTNKPNLIPGRPSHGCVRVPNAKIRRLARLMPIGTPVLVQG